MLRKFQTRANLSTGFSVFSTVRGISRPQFYNPFSTVFLHAPAVNNITILNHCINFIVRALHGSCNPPYAEHRAKRINFSREHMTMDMLDIIGAIIALTALARLIFA